MVHLLETVQYGFTTFTQLALISPTKEMAILINRRVLTNFEHDYTYHTHKLIDFFVCDKNPNIKRMLSKYKWLSKYSKNTRNIKKRIIYFCLTYMGFRLSSLLLSILVKLYKST